jgi:hypothetical protein
MNRLPGRNAMRSPAPILTAQDRILEMLAQRPALEAGLGTRGLNDAVALAAELLEGLDHSRRTLEALHQHALAAGAYGDPAGRAVQTEVLHALHQ